MKKIIGLSILIIGLSMMVISAQAHVCAGNYQKKECSPSISPTPSSTPSITPTPYEEETPSVTPSVTPIPEVTREVTPTPDQPKDNSTPPTFAGSTTGTPGVCSDTVPGNIANINVVSGVPNDGKVEVQWSIPSGADKVHIRYEEYSQNNWPYSKLNTQNDGHEEIANLKNGVNYRFEVAGVNGCAVGSWSQSFDPMP